MPEPAEMADDQVVEPDRVDRVPAAQAAGIVVPEGPDPGHQDLLDLVLAGAPKHDRLTTDGPEARMLGVVVGDRDQIGGGLGDGAARLRVGGIGKDDPLATAGAEACVSQPGEAAQARVSARMPMGILR